MPIFFVPACSIFNELTKLSAHEKKVFDGIINTLQSSDEAKKASLATIIGQYPLSTLFKFSHQNQDGKILPASELFFDFCNSQPDLQQKWAERMEKTKHPFFAITDVRGELRYSIFNQFLAAFIYDKFLKSFQNQQESKQETDNSDLFKLLTMACDYGSFSAIAHRQKINFDSFTTSPNEVQHKMLSELVGDVMQIGELFWSAGFAQSAILFFGLAKNFQIKKQNVLASYFYKAALEAICTAEKLSYEKFSEQLTTLLFPEGIKIAIDEREICWKTWTEAAKFVMKIGGLSQEDYNLAEKDANKRIEGFTKNTKTFNRL